MRATPQLQRIDVEVLGALERDPREEAVVEHPLDGIGVQRLTGGEEHPPSPLDAADRRTGFGVRAVRGQLVLVAERLALPTRTETAGDVGLRRPHVLELPFQRVEQVGVAGLEGDVGRSGREVDRAHRVPFDRGGLADRDAIGEVRRLVTVVLDDAVAAGLDEPLGLVEVGRRTGFPIQLDQGHLDHRVAVDVHSLVVAEGRDQVVGELDRDVQERTVAGAADLGDGGLDQVAGAVVLVAPDELL